MGAARGCGSAEYIKYEFEGGVWNGTNTLGVIIIKGKMHSYLCDINFFAAVD